MNAAVYFDIDETLVWRTSHEEDITNTAAAFGLDIDEDAIDCYGALTAQYFQRNATDPYRQSIEQWCEHYGFDIDPAAFAEEMKRRQVHETHIDEGVAAALDSLAEVATLGVLTNGASDLQRAKLDHHDLDGYFDPVIISGETDLMKPLDGFFDLATEALPVNDYVYVGDRLATDIVPARENGFVGVLVGDTSPLADHAVESVAELTGDDLAALFGSV